MANLKSSQKDIRRIEKRTARNVEVRSRLKTLRKKTRAAVQSGDAEQVAEASRAYFSALDKAAKNRVIHPNRADREKSRLSTAASKAAAS